MREYQDKRKRLSRIYSKYSIVFLLILIILIGKSVFDIYKKEKESRKAMLISKENLIELEERKQKLESEINNLRTAEGLEAEIRTKFNVVKPGEQLIIVVKNDSDKNLPKEEPNIIIRLWNWLTK